MIVIDCGCMDYAKQNSIRPLIDRFEPELLFGFDPHPECRPSMDFWEHTTGKTLVVRSRSAAWVSAGYVSIIEDGSQTRVVDDLESDQVASCFNLSAFLFALQDHELVLKLDVEGAEVPVLKHLHKTGADARLKMILVEWHDQRLDLPFRCPVEDWH